LSTALALPEGTNAQIVDKTIDINTAMNNLVFAGQADLDTAKNAVQTVNQSLYTSASWTLFESARTTALTLPETTNAEVITKRIALNTALTGLITLVDSAALAAVVGQATSLVQSDYTGDTWSTLSTALALPETTNALVVAKTTSLQAALAGLVRALAINTTTPEIIITQSSQVTIDNGVTQPLLDVSSLITAGT
jgi:hypothetical protein